MIIMALVFPYYYYIFALFCLSIAYINAFSLRSCQKRHMASPKPRADFISCHGPCKHPRSITSYQSDISSVFSSPQCLQLCSKDDDNGKKEPATDDVEKKDEASSSIFILQGELDNIQNQLFLIEALEARSEAQLYSFIDERDQWDSLEEEERQLLLKKPRLLNRRAEIDEFLSRIQENLS
mmetsp:Transcript_16364/g.34244  ORF Transcript_16364/g.34244 Transcript_16364/m.34244 type:complete len:181 (+) Transcript_16364:140-682(+)